MVPVKLFNRKCSGIIFGEKLFILIIILINFWEGADLAWGPIRPPMGPADRVERGRSPLLMARARVRWRGRRGGVGLRVPPELRFPSYVENKRQEIKAFLLLVHGES